MNKTPIKTNATRVLILSVFLVSSLSFRMAMANEKQAVVAIPNTPAAIWQSIDNEADETAKLLQAGTLKDLHHHAFAIRDLVEALPGHSASLPSDKLAKVKSDGKFVATLAERLDAAGDGNDKASAASSFTKLQTVLKSLRANYPDITPNEK